MFVRFCSVQYLRSTTGLRSRISVKVSNGVSDIGPGAVAMRALPHGLDDGHGAKAPLGVEQTGIQFQNHSV